jgi:hypothetical protein
MFRTFYCLKNINSLFVFLASIESSTYIRSKNCTYWSLDCNPYWPTVLRSGREPLILQPVRPSNKVLNSSQQVFPGLEYMLSKSPIFEQFFLSCRTNRLKKNTEDSAWLYVLKEKGQVTADGVHYKTNKIAVLTLYCKQTSSTNLSEELYV